MTDITCLKLSAAQSLDGPVQDRDPEEHEETVPLLGKGKALEVVEDYDSNPHALVPAESMHLPFLDVTRIICVTVVCVDHGNWAYGMWNYYFCQGWVLQYLFLVSGVALAMSKKSVWGYSLRLAKYVVVGIGVNWTAWSIAGLDWQHNFFNVVFQLWFVVAVILYSAMLAPLKPYLSRLRAEAHEQTRRERILEAAVESPEDGAPQPRRSEDATSFFKILCYLVGGYLGIQLLFRAVLGPLLAMVLSSHIVSMSQGLGAWSEHWGLPQDPSAAAVFVHRLISYPMLTVTNLFLVFICPIVFKRIPITAWAIIFNTVATRALFFRGSEERPFHGFDIVMIGLVSFYTGLLHRRKVGEYVIRYWFMVLFVLALCWPPGLYGRLDERPPTELGMRAMSAIMEGTFIVVWLVAGERMIQGEIFTEDRFGFMNDAALLAFLVHKAVHILVSPPVSWVILVSLVPLCYLLTLLRRKV